MKGSFEGQAEEIARVVKEARRRQGLSQDDLALLAETSRRPLYLLEQGKGSVRLETLLRILDALGLDLEIKARRGDR